MCRVLLPALLSLSLSGCASMINKKLESAFTEAAQVYADEDLEAIMANVPENFSRVLADGTVVEGRDAYRAHLQDLFDANENIRLEVLNVMRDGDEVIMEYVFHSKAVGPRANGLDLTGTTLATHAIATFKLNDDKQIERIVDFYDRAAQAEPAGYLLMKPPPPPPKVTLVEEPSEPVSDEPKKLVAP